MSRCIRGLIDEREEFETIVRMNAGETVSRRTIEEVYMAIFGESFVRIGQTSDCNCIFVNMFDHGGKIPRG